MDKCPRCGHAVEPSPQLEKVFRYAYHCPNCNAFYFGGEKTED